MEKKYTIIHLSDLHYSFPEWKITNLTNKRSFGLTNEIILKKSYRYNEQRKKLLKSIAEKEWDLLCITGDFSNLSYAKEFQKAKSQIEYYFGNREIIVLAGNHDRYIKKTTREEHFESYFKKYIVFNWNSKKEYSIHTRKIFKNFLLVFFDMAVPRPWFSARGALSHNFFQEYQQKICKSELTTTHKIGFGHYPVFMPAGKKPKFWRSFKHHKKLASCMLKDNFHVYCHGHIHHSWQTLIQFKENSIWSLNGGGVILNKNTQNQFYNKIVLHPNGKIVITPLFY